MESATIIALISGGITLVTLMAKKCKIYLSRSPDGCNCVVGFLDKALPIKEDNKED